MAMRFCVAIFVFGLLLACCPVGAMGSEATLARRSNGATPTTFLWAWKRNEDLRFIDPAKYGVAYLACHAFVKADAVKFEWRNQQMYVPPNTTVIPVVRIDTFHPSMSLSQVESIAKVIARAAAIVKTDTVQIDFDARQTERDFYKQIIAATRQQLPPGKKLSITALASWCMFDDWIRDLPVDESIPMMFSLGPEKAKVLNYFASRNDFRVPLCWKSIGLSIDEPDVTALMILVVQKRTMPCRFYFFSRTAWNDKKLQIVEQVLGEK